MKRTFSQRQAVSLGRGKNRPWGTTTPAPAAAGKNTGNVASEGKLVQPDSSFFCKEMKHLIKQKNQLFPKVKKLIMHAKIQGKGAHFGIGAVPMRTEQAR